MPIADPRANLDKDPDKTFIGRIERGFDFLGYHVTPEGLRVEILVWHRDGSVDRVSR